jgi:hypothetical protein
VPQRWWRGVEGPPTVLSYPCCLELFNHGARTGRARHGLSLEPRTKNLLYIGVTSNLYLRVMQGGHVGGFHCDLWLQAPALL